MQPFSERAWVAKARTSLTQSRWARLMATPEIGTFREYTFACVLTLLACAGLALALGKVLCLLTHNH